MKSTDAGLIAFLAANRQFCQADLYDIAFADGSHLYLTSADVNLVVAGITYVATGPLMQRSKLKQVRGVQVDTLSLVCHATTGNLLDGTGWQTALLQGALDGAYVTLSRLVFASWANPNQFGPTVIFYGRVADLPQVGYGSVQINVKSPLSLADNQVPWQLYQAPCAYSLYDANCGASRSFFAQSGYVQDSEDNTNLAFLTNLTQPDGWFTLGKVQMTSGAAAGQTRSLKAHNGARLTVMVPWIGAGPAPGDSFTAWAGCDRQMSTCLIKFNNLLAFGGQPFIPAPTTAA
jgi:uncharacterized phage protein (TIGR02218 family)